MGSFSPADESDPQDQGSAESIPDVNLMLPSDLAKDVSAIDMDTMIACDDPRNFMDDFIPDIPESILAEWENAKESETGSPVERLKDDEDTLNEFLTRLPKSTQELLHEFRFRPSYIGKIHVATEEEALDTKEDLSEYVSDDVRDKFLAESDIAELESEEAYE